MRNRTWNRDELILALDVYFSILPQIVHLSEMLRRMPPEVGEKRADNFRSPASVIMKLTNFLAIDPDLQSPGLSRVAKGDRKIWDEFAKRREELTAAARAIRARMSDAR